MLIKVANKSAMKFIVCWKFRVYNFFFIKLFPLLMFDFFFKEKFTYSFSAINQNYIMRDVNEWLTDNRLNNSITIIKKSFIISVFFSIWWLLNKRVIRFAIIEKKITFSRERLTLDKCKIRKKLYFTFCGEETDVFRYNCARNYKSIFFHENNKIAQKIRIKTTTKNRRIIAMAFDCRS